MVTSFEAAELQSLIGLSSDIKPTGYNNGTKFYEMDTGYVFRYDAGGAIWVSPDLDVKSITIKTAPSKTTYFAGEQFNPAGVVITVTFKDDDTKDITSGFTYTPSGALQTTDTSVTFSYGGKTATQAITVNAVVVTSIAVKTAPTVTAYSAESNVLSMAGLEITATYNNETTADIAYNETTAAEFTFSPVEGSTVTESGNVTITYAQKTCTQAITYA